jgi:hypothetical protein
LGVRGVGAVERLVSGVVSTTKPDPHLLEYVEDDWQELVR